MWRKRRGSSKAIAELAVDNGIRNIEEVTLRVEHYAPGVPYRLLWER
jgi:hypothetical protein